MKVCVSTAFVLGTLASSFAGEFLQASSRCCHSSGFSLSQFIHVITDALDDGEFRSLCGADQLLSLCKQKSNWIITL